MKDKFDFPRFEDLQLGLSGTKQGYGCLLTKIDEVVESAELTKELAVRLNRRVDLEIGYIDGQFSLYSVSCPNTLSNRRKAYDVLVLATEEVLGVDIGS